MLIHLMGRVAMGQWRGEGKCCGSERVRSGEVWAGEDSNCWGVGVTGREWGEWSNGEATSCWEVGCGYGSSGAME